MAKGTYEGFKQPDENEPWAIRIQLRPPRNSGTLVQRCGCGSMLPDHLTTGSING